MPDNLPKHIGIIMDGNRRWAKQHGLELLRGHEYVANKVIQDLVDRAIELKIPYMTFWAFSTENWRRDKTEVDGLMKLFREAFKRQSEELHRKGVRLKSIGDISRFPEDIQKGIRHWEEISSGNKNITVNFALNYGGRDEVLRAVNGVLAEGKKKVDEKEFSEYLDTKGMPDPDLIIRPGGEKRLSGFLPWQAVYAELYFTDLLMPDFTPERLDEALADFGQRQRRYGR